MSDTAVYRNALLGRLTRTTAAKLAPHLHDIEFDAEQILNEPGEDVRYAVFPHTGMISTLVVLAEGAIETATIGREGGVGLLTGFGTHTALTRVTAQTPVRASRIAASQFHRLVTANDEWRTMIVRANEALLAQAQVGSACRVAHDLEARLARWILQSADRVEGDWLPLTHEMLSEMLGVRRSSVSEIAARLQDAKLISYSRGKLTIKNRAGLKRVSCECYALNVDNTAHIFRS